MSALRVWFVTLAGLAILQSSSELGAAKLIYLAGVAAALAFALLNLWPPQRFVDRRWTRRLMQFSFSVLLLVAISLLVALSRGIGFIDWLRDVSGILLLAAAPFFAIDVQSSRSRASLTYLLVIGGVVAAASISVTFLSARHLGDLPTEHIGLATGSLANALFSYAGAQVLVGRRNRVPWALLAVLVLSSGLVAGNRSTLIFLASPLTMRFATDGSSVGRRLITGGLITAITLAAAFFVVTNVIERGLASSYIIDRVYSTVGLLRDPGSDESVTMRISQTLSLLAGFVSNPVLGTGPGQTFRYLNRSGKIVESMSVVDSPMVFPAKFGLVGIAELGVIVWSLVSFVRRLIREEGLTTPRLALLGFISYSGAFMLVGPIYEDKGFALSLMLLIGLSLPRRRNWGSRRDLTHLAAA